MGTTVDEKKHYDDHDIATFIARKEFEKRHPEEEQPEWLKKYMLTTGRKTGSKKWTMRKILFYKEQLGPNQYWEKSLKGNPVLVEKDPETGKEFVVLKSGSPENIKVLFEVEVDVSDGTARVCTDIDISTLDVNKRMPLKIWNPFQVEK